MAAFTRRHEANTLVEGDSGLVGGVYGQFHGVDIMLPSPTNRRDNDRSSDPSPLMADVDREIDQFSVPVPERQRHDGNDVIVDDVRKRFPRPAAGSHIGFRENDERNRLVIGHELELLWPDPNPERSTPVRPIDQDQLSANEIRHGPGLLACLSTCEMRAIWTQR